MEKSTQISEQDLALCRSAIYEALSLGFRHPDEEALERLLSEEHNEALAEIAALLDVAAGGRTRGALASFVRNLRSCKDQRIHELEASFRDLFGHTAQGSVPPYETEYGEETLFQQPHQLADLGGFYSAFGLHLNSMVHERVDSVVCECEFLAFLARKEAYALEHQIDSMLAETRKAQKLFLKDHLARFAPAFTNLLVRENAAGFYSRLGELCRAFVLQECARFGVKAGPEHLRFRQDRDGEGFFSCGGGQEVITDICGSCAAADTDHDQTLEALGP